MKKGFSLILLALLLSLVACGNDTDKSTNGTQVQKNQTEQKEPAKQEDSTNSNTEKEGEDQLTTLPQFTDVQGNEKLIAMETSKGTIKIKLFPDQAPKAVENFLTHSEQGYYDGVLFHRVIDSFMIQGGDPQGTGMGGESIWGSSFEDEFSEDLFNFRGALSMANAGANMNGSQFFIVQAKTLDPNFKGQMEQANYPKVAIDKYLEVGGTPWLDHKHTVFGQVVEGMDVVDTIATAAKGANDKPKEDIVIKSIKILK